MKRVIWHLNNLFYTRIRHGASCNFFCLSHHLKSINLAKNERNMLFHKYDDVNICFNNLDSYAVTAAGAGASLAAGAGSAGLAAGLAGRLI